MAEDRNDPDNIMMGRPDAAEEEMIEAAKASHIHGFIRRLPKGYDTWITEDGGGLSQGQKQLLCIARVMLCRPPMLILDEATSSIDTRTEMRIQAAFAKLMEGRTNLYRGAQTVHHTGGRCDSCDERRTHHRTGKP